MKCKYCEKEFIPKGKENFCSKSCAGKFNVEKSRNVSARLKQKRIEDYNSNPKRCKFCNEPLPYEKRHLNFCNASCAASYNNTHKKQKQKEKRYCLNCGKELLTTNSKYCSNKCQQEYSFKLKIEQVEKDNSFESQVHTLYGITEANRRFVYKYLIHKYGHKCSICGNTHWLGKPILLIVDHIDGNIDNYKIDNYRLICSNCDATLPTYKNKNKNNGKRKYRRVKNF